MPEHRLIEAVVAALKEAMEAQSAEHIRRAHIKIGETASVTPELVETFLRKHNSNIGLDTAEFVVEIVPILGECEKCGKIVEINGRLCCQECGTPYVTLSDHNAVLVSSCEVED